MSAKPLSDSQILSIKRLLLIQLDPVDPLNIAEEAIRTLQQYRPELYLMRLTPFRVARCCAVQEDDGCTVSYTIAGDVPLSVYDNNPRTTIQWIQDQHMDAAIVFADKGRSPYTWAYRCYLAGVPIRIGQSQEFGGQVLSHYSPPADIDTPNPYLHLLQTCRLLETDIDRTYAFRAKTHESDGFLGRSAPQKSINCVSSNRHKSSE